MVSALGKALAQAISKDVALNIHHIATPATPCAAIFSAPPGQREEMTTCESHFLTVTFHSPTTQDEDDLLVYAVEALVYNTESLTTVFVSKADTTGYLYDLSSRARGLVRTVSTIFLTHIIELYREPGKKQVLSLFARAQNQYLFPGSIDNPHKHVLDDRQLIKWWCRVIDPILQQFNTGQLAQEEQDTLDDGRFTAVAYLIIPGCDQYETRAFFPQSTKFDTGKNKRWLNTYPQHAICPNPNAPPRCLLPRFPDDPKARFLLELDDEIPGLEDSTDLPKGHDGQWRSVKTLEQFWEMMSFRQECSAGRLVGFLWMIITPSSSRVGLEKPSHEAGKGTEVDSEREQKSITNMNADNNILDHGDHSERPQVSHQPNQSGEQNHPSLRSDEIVLTPESYQVLLDHLLQLEFDTKKASIESTRSYFSKLTTLFASPLPHETVVGQHVPELPADNQDSSLNVLGMSVVRKRKKEASISETVDKAFRPPATDNDINDITSQTDTVTRKPKMNILGADVIRKKKKPA